ncbi:MAG TPA: response regulator [Arcobacter sp.]|nr:response regulator [Arcobacter sp.]
MEEAKDIKVLYVEDNDETRNQTVKMLKNYFTKIVTAIDGVQGLQKFKTEHFDIVFTDINMPNSNGIEMITKIRELDKNVPVIIFTAFDKTEYFLETINQGIDGYILKPYDLAQFNATINKTIDKLITKKDQQTNIIQLNDIYTWDIAKSVLKENSTVIKLTRNEMKLMNLMVTDLDATFSSFEIENYIFHDDEENNKRIRNLVSRLNKKLEHTLIEAVYGVGYKIAHIKD